MNHEIELKPMSLLMERPSVKERVFRGFGVLGPLLLTLGLVILLLIIALFAYGDVNDPSLYVSLGLSALLIIFGVMILRIGSAGIDRYQRELALRNLDRYEELRTQISGMYCAYCDYPIRISGSTFCPNCGTRLISMF